MSRIIVGVSGSLANLAAVRQAVELARRTSSPLIGVLAWQPVGGEISYRRAPCPPLLQVWRNDAERRVHTAFEETFGDLPNDIDVRVTATRGEVGPVLINCADSIDDLLILGRGHRLGARPGRVVRYCQRHARSAVLIVASTNLRPLRRFSHHLDDEIRFVDRHLRPSQS